MKPTLLGQDKIPFSDHKSFHPFETPKTWGRKVITRVETALHGVETPAPSADR